MHIITVIKSESVGLADHAERMSKQKVYRTFGWETQYEGTTWETYNC
jgi:hypothetical protein